MRTRKFASETSRPLATSGNNQKEILVYVKRLDFKGSAWFYRWFFLFLCITEHMKRSLFFLEWIIFFDACCSATEIQAFSELIWLKSWDRLSDVCSFNFLRSVEYDGSNGKGVCWKYTILSHYFTTFLFCS